jgi:hypothetical protein
LELASIHVGITRLKTSPTLLLSFLFFNEAGALVIAIFIFTYSFIVFIFFLFSEYSIVYPCHRIDPTIAQVALSSLKSSTTSASLEIRQNQRELQIIEFRQTTEPGARGEDSDADCKSVRRQQSIVKSIATSFIYDKKEKR